MRYAASSCNYNATVSQIDDSKCYQSVNVNVNVLIFIKYNIWHLHSLSV